VLFHKILAQSGTCRARWLKGHVQDALRNFKAESENQTPNTPLGNAIFDLIAFLESDDVNKAFSGEGLLSEAVKSTLHKFYDSIQHLAPLGGVHIEQGKSALQKIFNKPLFFESEVTAVSVDTANTQKKSPKVLVVDDSKVATKCFEKMFQSILRIEMGTTFAEGQALFKQALTQSPYMGIVLDNHIGQDSGVVLATEIRAKAPNLPILMLSGSVPNEEDQRRLKELGIPVMGKPVNMQDVKDFFSGLV
jgi:CheY-like chemotaxis protein